MNRALCREPRHLVALVEFVAMMVAYPWRSPSTCSPAAAAPRTAAGILILLTRLARNRDELELLVAERTHSLEVTNEQLIEANRPSPASWQT